MARALGGLPAIDAALHEGSLSYSKVRAMTRVATVENEQELLELAVLATASQLERICRGYRQIRRDLNGEEPEPERKVDWHWDRGMLVLQARLPAEEGELVLQALRGATELLRREADGEPEDGSGELGDDSAEAPEEVDSQEPRSDPAEASEPFRPSLADGLCAMAETSLASGLSAAPSGERTQVVLHLGPGRCHLDEGPALDLSAALRLACDAQLLPVSTGKQGRVLDVGRARRSIPSAIRRALTLRDGGCRFPGCTCRRFVDGHHVRHWAHGGETKLENLILLCKHHHRLIHEQGFEIRTDGGDFDFFDPKGRPLDPSPRVPAAVRADIVTPSAEPAAGHHGPWDCGWAIGGLLELDGVA